MKRKEHCPRIISVLIMSFLAIIIPSVISCSDFNIFSSLKDYKSEIDKASALELLYLFDNRDVTIYLYENKEYRDELLLRLKTEQTEAPQKTTEQILYYQMASVKIAMESTELRFVPASLSQNLITFIYTQEDIDNVDLSKFAEINLKHLYAKDENYISNYFDAIIQVQELLKELATTLGQQNVDFPNDFLYDIGFYVDSAYISTSQHLMYRWHRVIDDAGMIRIKKCPGSPPICTIDEIDDYKEVLIKHLIEDENYSDIFNLMPEDNFPDLTTAPEFSLKANLFAEGFLYDHNTTNSLRSAGDNKLCVILVEGNQQDFLTKLDYTCTL